MISTIYKKGEWKTRSQYTVSVPSVSTETKQLKWWMDSGCAHVQSWPPLDTFSTGQLRLCSPITAPPWPFRADNHVLSQKYTKFFLPCLAASVKHWGSKLNECVCSPHKLLKEKVMQIFHFHSSRLWPQGNLCGCVISAESFQLCSDLACEINSPVKGLGFVLKYCWKASQWFHWLKRKLQFGQWDDFIPSPSGL